MPRDAVTSRDRLVAATRAILDEQGYSTLRVADVARRAGLTTGALYAIFRSKHALVAAALDERSPGALAAASGLAATHPTEAALALDALDTRGCAKLRLADVARAAGTTAAELRRAFPDVHHLVAAAIVATAPDRYADAIADLARGADPATPAPTDASTRDRLLAAALDALDTVGYRGARIGDIARRAGVTTGAVYKNFASKDALLDAAMARRYGQPFRRALSDADSGPGRLLTGFTAALQYDADMDHRPLVELLALAARDPAAGSPLAHEFDRRQRTMADLIEEAKADGEVAADVPTDGLAHLLQLLALGNIVLRTVGARHPSPTEVEDTLRRLRFRPSAGEGLL